MTTPLTQSEGAQLLCELVEHHTIKPFIAGKIGTSEFEALITFLQRKKKGLATYPEHVRKNLCVNAGFFPETDVAIDAWATHMLKDILPAMDVTVEWNPAYSLMEKNFLDMYAPTSKRIRLRSLEPYYESSSENVWTQRIAAGTKVAVVSPFSASITSQWPHREEIWSKRPIWNMDAPEILPIQSGYGPMLTKSHGWPTCVLEGGWKSAVRYITDKVVASGATLAIIGCGALSLPIAYALKQHDISAIHTGGATQIMFGIQGRRWVNHEIISTFFNDAWSSPLPLEIPTEASKVEGGCYW